MTTWNILYRGSLTSCNYACNYCPFAKTSNSLAELQKDRNQLERFVQWVKAQSPRRIGILITPWGEGLVHRYYRSAMIELSHLPHVDRIAIQTNLSASVDEFAAANRQSLALWTTFHPSQTSIEKFVSRCHELDQLDVRYSVGVVGLREHFNDIIALRKRLRPEVYLWINAYKREKEYYNPDDLKALSAIDPYFHWNTKKYPSTGKACAAGESTFAADGDGHVRRCHFLPGIIGNIYEPGFPSCLKPRLCTGAECGCHIGYVHLREFRLPELYGAGLMERIPASWPDIQPQFTRAF